MEQFVNHTPHLLFPVLRDSGIVPLRQVDGVGREERANPNSVTTLILTVRNKNVHRILGEDNSMLINISEVSGASVSVSVDVRSALNQNMYITLWGIPKHVDAAEGMIDKLIREEYDEPVQAFSHSYVHHQVRSFPIDTAVYLLKENNLVRIEGDTYTWIEVDATKAWKKGATREVDIHFYGYKENINKAVNMINTSASKAPTGTLKKTGTLNKARRVLVKGTKVTSKFVWTGLKSAYRKMKKKKHH